METIRNYLENMFLNLPNTKEVQKAKSELLQMMEDKYMELKEEGKTENEAVGIVISEFGNLDELAGDLGIEGVMNKDCPEKGKLFSMEEAKKYLSERANHAYYTALGVFLCIISVCGPIFFSGFGALNEEMEDFFSVLGMIFLFAVIAIAVGIFVYSGMMAGDWERLDKEPYFIDFATTEYVHQCRENYKTTHALRMTVGIILCILCVIPPIVLDSTPYLGKIWDDFSGGFMFIMIGIGVFMIVLTSIKWGSYDKLLKLNEKGTMGGNFVESQQEHYNSKEIKVMMSVYWPTITCIYLIWSFLTFDWHVTWIIWPVAAVLHSLIKSIDESSK